MTYYPNNPNGQATKANSAPVTIASDQGDLFPVQLNATQSDVTGSITTSTTTVTATDLMGVGSVTVSIYGTYAGVNVTFEAYDGVNWVAIAAQPLSSITPTLVTATGVLVTNSTNMYNVSPLLGVKQFRVRATAFTSGSASVVIMPSAQFVQFFSTVNGTSTVSGTVTANLGTGGTAATSLGKAEDAVHASGDTGVMALSVRNDNLSTTFAANGDYQPIATDLGGRVMVSQKAATGTLSNVAASATSVTVLAANSARIGATITNDSSAVIYIKLGATASTTSYTVSLGGQASAPFSYYEIPAGYTGVVDAIWASATGNARITEIS